MEYTLRFEVIVLFDKFLEFRDHPQEKLPMLNTTSDIVKDIVQNITAYNSCCTK